MDPSASYEDSARTVMRAFGPVSHVRTIEIRGMWRSVTNHEALPVEEGRKYAANVWIHNYDYRTPAAANCLLTHKNTH